MAAGSDGSIWFNSNGTQSYERLVARMTESGSFQKILWPSGWNYAAYGASVTDMVIGSDGALWFTDLNGSEILRISSGGQFTNRYFIYSYGSDVRGIASGPDGALWYTRPVNNKIGRLTTTGEKTEYQIPSAGSRPSSIATGSDGNLWFIETQTSKIGKITISGEVTEYSSVSPNMSLYSSKIATGPDGALWFSERSNDDGSSKIGRISTSGDITEYPLAENHNIMAGPISGLDGALWFTEYAYENGLYENKLGRITAAGEISEYSVFGEPQASLSYIGGMTVGSDGKFWFTNNQANQLIRVDQSQLMAPSGPENLSATSPTIQNPALSWDEVSGVSAYNIYRNGVKIDTTVNLSYIDNVSEGSYAYYVTAVNDSGVESVASNSAVVIVDRTNPVITYTVNPSPINNGWWSSESVTVTFHCNDDGAGIESCSAPVTLTNEGGNQQVTGNSVDKAGNTSTTTATVNIDRTPPIIIAHISAEPNSYGWYNTAPTITFDCTSISGIEVCPDPITVGEGEGQTVTGETTSNAGGSSSTTVPVNVDETAPTVDYVVGDQPNIHGWYNAPVTVSFTCSDALSGVASCTNPITLTEDGIHTVTGAAVDKAGNAKTITLTIKIDSTQPTIESHVSNTNSNGWYNGDVIVSFTCNDNLSGVDECPNAVILNQEGGQTLTATAVDKAGNPKTISVHVNIDKTTPTISYTLSPVPNSNGWNNGEVVVTFNCDDALSGIESCTGPVTLIEDGTYAVTGTAVDKAGNTFAINAIVSVDTTAPAVVSNPSTNPNENGWYNGDTTVAFDCSDALSGIDTCSDPVTLSEGAGQIVAGTAVDKAGNSSLTSMSVDIDKTAPNISYSLSQSPNANGWNSTDVTVTFDCNDALSGVTSCTDPITLTEEGIYVVTGTAVDNAGNIVSINVEVQIDKASPVVGDPVWSANPSALGSNTTLTVSATDDISGATGGEFFINSDPGVGSGTAMTWDGANLSAIFGSDLPTGYYTIGIRSYDAAGNWSGATYAYLVVYNPNGPTQISGSKGFVPSLANGDILPGLISASQNDRATMSFDISYDADGMVSAISSFGFTYSTGQACNSVDYFNCYNTDITTININSLTFVGTDYSVGIFEGVGTLTINGVPTEVIFRVEAKDGKIIGNRIPDTFSMKVYSAGVNPSDLNAVPIYQVTTSLTGNGVVVSQ